MTRDELIAHYRRIHAGDTQFAGNTLLSYRKDIAKAVRDSQAQTALDWGSGKGVMWKSWRKSLGLARVVRYDPAVAGLDTPPAPGEQFDLVICCDVLEHVIEDDVSPLVARLFGHARHLVWASVCCRPAKKMFPGTDINMHVTVRPYDWWAEQFRAQARQTGVSFTLRETP